VKHCCSREQPAVWGVEVGAKSSKIFGESMTCLLSLPPEQPQQAWAQGHKPLECSWVSALVTWCRRQSLAISIQKSGDYLFFENNPK